MSSITRALMLDSCRAKPGERSGWSRRSAKVVSISLALGVVAGACAPPQPDSTFSRKPTTDEDTSGNMPIGSLGDTSGGEGSSGAPDEFQECATKTATAEAKPVYLVFMFDKSGSMVLNNSPKWSAAKAASKAFFESDASKGVHASLAFFPNQSYYSCDADTYATPRVSMTALPDASFGAMLDAQQPVGGTPTYVALEGAIKYAKKVAANEGKDGTVAIVLVTDGLPESDCTGNSVSSVKTLAASVAATLPTYVIGVGNQLTSLREIAVGGGTKDALIVKADDPQQIRDDFLSAVNAIKLSALACDYEIPPPPAGEQLDRDRVNVIHKVGDSSTTIPHDPSCTTGAGWRYDDEDDPKRILLCDASCDVVKTKPGQMEVLFGCATKNGGVK